MLKYIKRISAKQRFALAFITGLLLSLIAIGVSMAAGRMIDAVLETPGLFVKGALLVGAAYVSQILISTASCWFGETFEYEEIRRMRDRAFAAHLHKKHVGSSDVAEFIALVNEHIVSAVSQIYTGTMHIIICTIGVLSCSFALFTMNWLWALIIISASVAMVLVPRTLNKRGQAATNAYMGAVQRQMLKLQSFLNGHALVRAFGFYDGANRQMQDMTAERAKRSRRRWFYSTTVYGVSASLNMLQNASILIVGLFLILKGSVTLGELIAAIQLAINICGTMEALSFYIHERNESLPLLRQYDELLEEAERSKAAEFAKRSVEVVSTLELRNVCFDADGESILRRVDITLEREGKYLLYGPSGCGKSTALRILARMLEPSSGEVLLNGQPVQGFDLQDYYSNICMMPQDSFLFYATLKENILLGRNVPDEQYAALLRAVNLEHLAGRMENTPLDKEQLENLSGGEKQRICLARTMAGKPQIYLLDEITSSLDAKNTDEIMEILFKLDAICVFVCHHPKDEWKKHWKQIYQFDLGRIYPQ